MSQCRPGPHARQLVVSRVGRRPNRVEPRAVTRRPKPHALLTYTLTVGNVGGRNLNEVVLGMVVPEFTSVSSSSITGGGGCGQSTCFAGQEVVWALGTLVAGESRTVMMAARVESVDPPDGTLLLDTARAFHPGEGLTAVDDVYTRWGYDKP